MKIRSMLAAACACLITSGSILSFTTALPAQAAFGLGDFDGNDSIDVDDAVSVLTFYAKAAAGVAVNDMTGKEAETTVFKIHYSKNGIHIVPDYPSKKKVK